MWLFETSGRDGNPKSDEASEFAHLGGQGYGSTQQVDSCLEGYRFRVGFECACEQVRRCCNFYEDCLNAGGTEQERGYGRSILKDFSNDAQIKSLQSDGYNVYMYLDDELIEVPPCPCAE